MKKHATKRCLSVLLSVIIVYSCSFAFAADATSLSDATNPVTVQWANVDCIAAGLSISTSGKATCAFNIELSNSTDTATVYMYLQRLDDGNWTNVSSWAKTGSGDFSGSNYCYVASGYYYRNHVAAYVYDSSGNFVEYVSKNSPQQYY